MGALARGSMSALARIATGYTKFAIETMMDEIAALKKEPDRSLSAGNAPERTARANAAATRRRHGGYSKKRDGRAVASPIGRAAQPRRWRPKSRSTPRPARSQSIICAAVDARRQITVPKNIAAQMKRDDLRACAARKSRSRSRAA
jgi:hypothetical protein